MDCTFGALFLIIVPSLKAEPERPESSMQSSAPGVPLLPSQLLLLLHAGSIKKVTCLLAHIQLCLIDIYTRVKQLFAAVSLSVKDAVLIVIASLLSNVCVLLKNPG